MTKGVLGTTTHSEVVTKTEHYWEFSVAYQLILYEGNEPDRHLVRVAHTHAHTHLYVARLDSA